MLDCGRQKRAQRGQDVCERDERHVDGDDIDLIRHRSARSASRVDAFADDDARVGAQSPIELAVSDVKSDD